MAKEEIKVTINTEINIPKIKRHTGNLISPPQWIEEDPYFSDRDQEAFYKALDVEKRESDCENISAYCSDLSTALKDLITATERAYGGKSMQHPRVTQALLKAKSALQTELF